MGGGGGGSFEEFGTHDIFSRVARLLIILGCENLGRYDFMIIKPF